MDEQAPGGQDAQPSGETQSAPPPMAPPVAWGQAPAEATGIPVPGSPGIYFAGMWPRFAAFLLDNLLLILAYILISIVTAAAGFGSSFGTSSVSTGGARIGTVILGLLSAAYFILQWRGGHRATFGMRALGIQVGNAFDGGRLTDRQALIRWATLGYPLGLLGVIPNLSGLAGLINIVLVIGLFLTTLGSTTRQGWHDQFANSAVVRRPGATASNTPAVIIVVCVFLLLILPLLAFIGFLASGSAV